MAKIWLTSEPSDVSGYYLALVDSPNPRTTALTAAVTFITSSQSAGSKFTLTLTSGGTELKWLTKPFKEDVTLSGRVFFQGWGSETNADANVTLVPSLYLYTNGVGTPTDFLLDTTGPAELTTSIARVPYMTAALNSVTSFLAGNRLHIVIKALALGTTGVARTVTFDFDGLTRGADGDSWIEVQEAVRITERQLGDGATVTSRGRSVGFFQDLKESLNSLIDGSVISTGATLRSVLDDIDAEQGEN